MNENSELERPQHPRRPHWVPYVFVHGILKYTVPILLIDFARHRSVGGWPSGPFFEFCLFVGIGIGHSKWNSLPTSPTSADANVSVRESAALVTVGSIALIAGTCLLPSMPQKHMPFIGMLLCFGSVMCIWGTFKSRASEYFAPYFTLSIAVIAWMLSKMAEV